MRRSDYDAYVAAFNAADFAGFTTYYTDDILFEIGDRKRLRGRDEIVAFYREVKSRVRETLTVVKFIGDDEGAAAEVETEFVALEDWPEFISGPLSEGDVYRRRGLIMYDLRDGLISHARAARIRVLESPW